MPRLTLYNWWRSSSSYRVRIALAMKELEYEYVAVRLSESEQTKAEHLARSPTGYVPCLVIDGAAYVESVAIIELLEELAPKPPLYPANRMARARVRALVEMINSGTQPLQNSSVLAEVQRIGGEAREGEWAKHFIARGLGAVERAIEGHGREGVKGPYAFGATPTAADCFVVPQCVNAQRYGVSLDPFPRVREAFEAAMQLEAFQRAAPERQVDADVVSGKR
jgi:maleylacetoacetate isomerase